MQDLANIGLVDVIQDWIGNYETEIIAEAIAIERRNSKWQCGQNTKEEIKQLRELAERILNRMDELVLSYDDADEKLACQRVVRKLNDAICDMVFLEQ